MIRFENKPNYLLGYKFLKVVLKNKINIDSKVCVVFCVVYIYITEVRRADFTAHKRDGFI